MKIAIDYDDTLWDKMGYFKDGARDALWRMHEAGHEITIYTSRHDGKWNQIAFDLKAADIPYDRIVGGKIFCNRYIGDEARQFTTWNVDYTKPL